MAIQMNLDQCIRLFKACIRHRERSYKEEHIFLAPDGTEVGRGKIIPENDSLYQAMKFALPILESLAESQK